MKDRTISIRAVGSDDLERVAEVPVALLAGGRRLGTFRGQDEIRIRGVQSLPPGELAARFQAIYGNDWEAHYRPIYGDNETVLLPRPLETYTYAAFVASFDGSAAELRLGTPQELNPEGRTGPGAASPVQVDWGCADLEFNVEGLESEGGRHLSTIECAAPGILAVECPTELGTGEEGTFTATVSAGLMGGDYSFESKTAGGLQAFYGEPVRALAGNGTHYRQWRSDWVVFDAPPALSWEEAMEQVNQTPDVSEDADWVATISFRGASRAESTTCVVHRNGETTLPGASAPREERAGAMPYFGFEYNLEFEQFAPRIGVRAPLPVRLPLYGDVSLGYLGDNGGSSSILLQAEAQCRTDLSPRMALYYGLGVHAQRTSYTGGATTEIGPGGSAGAAYELGARLSAGAEVNVSRLFGTTILKPAVRIGFEF